ncbi:MAG: DUF4097 family beta strand repeat protein [Elusimicrobia bacterium]|nr:DUF4097 family beta strand repeat protein [Elusimicrobiota bacterium]
MAAVLASWCVAAVSAAGPAAPAPAISAPKEFPLKEVKLIRVSADSGSIIVRGGKGDKARVTVVGSLDSCVIVTEVRGADLVVEAKHKFMKTCAAGFAVEAAGDLPVRVYAGSGDIEIVSRRAAVEADAGSGDIIVKQAAGDLTLRSGSGDIKAEASASNAKAQSGSGKVELTRLLGSASVMTGSGDIRLEWARPPQTGTAEVKSGSGNVDLVFPKGTRLASSVRTGTGSSSNELGDTPGAEWRVSVMSGTGNVRIRRPDPKK